MSTIILGGRDPKVSDHTLDADKSDGNYHLVIILWF